MDGIDFLSTGSSERGGGPSAVAVKEENAHPHPSFLTANGFVEWGWLPCRRLHNPICLSDGGTGEASCHPIAITKEGEGLDHNMGVRNAVYEA